MASIHVLAAVSSARARMYHTELSADPELSVQVCSDKADALDLIADRDHHVDILVIDNALGDVFDFVGQIRQNYPRLLIVLVDEDADFGLPGQADEMSVDPFEDNDLISKIKRLIFDRRMETQRSDSLPAVRQISQNIKRAVGALGKQEAVTKTIREMGYDYAAYYSLESSEPVDLMLRAQTGPNVITSIAPKHGSADDLMGWVAQNGQSRLAAPTDHPNHPLVARGRLGAVACVPVQFSGHHYGVIVACMDRPNSITQDNILMLELIATQLANALLQEERENG